MLHSAPLKNRMLALEIQKELLKRIISSENLIRKHKRKHKELKQSQRKQTKEQSDKTKKQLVNNKSAQRRQKYLLWVYRTFGDSIAFIYGDRWDLKQYAFKHDTGFISGNSGLKLEKAILIEGFKSGATVLMNDLTNNMRHADISFFRPDLWPDGGSPILFIEAKSGKGGNKARLARQEKAIKEITEYIYTDTKMVEGGKYSRVSAKTKPTYHNKTFVRMARKLKKGQWNHEEVEKGLHYFLVDNHCQEIEGMLSSIFDKKQHNLFFLSVNDLKEQVLGYYPFPLSINDPDILFHFYNGDFSAFIIVDIAVLNEELLKQNLEVSCMDDFDFPWKVKYVGKPKKNTPVDAYVGYHVIGRLAAEFISLKWIIGNVFNYEFLEAELEVLKDKYSTNS